MQKPQSPAPAVAPIPEKPLEYLLVDLTVGKRRLDTVVTALEDSKGIRFVPLRKISAVLGFRLEVNLVQHRAVGFLRSPKERLDINVPAGRAIHNGRATSFNPSVCFSQDDDLYVKADLFAALTGLTLHWKLDKLELDVSSETPLSLPDRKAKAVMTASRSHDMAAFRSLPLVTSPHRLWSPPSVDVFLSSTAGTGVEASQGNTTPALEGSGDLLYMDSKFRLTTDLEGRPWGLFSLGRSSADSDLLGAMRATAFELGDFVFPSLPLFSRGRAGYGFSVTNEQLDRTANSSDQLTGKAPPLSTIEVYRDGTMVAAAQVDAAGDYRVSDLRLDPGPNELTIVSVGEDGSVQQENRTVYGGASESRTKRPTYRFALGKQGSTLFGSKSFGRSGLEGPEVYGEVKSHLSPNTWMRLSASDVASGKYFGLGLTTWQGSTFFRFQAMSSSIAGQAASLSATKKFGPVSATLEHVRTSAGYEDPFADDISQGVTSATKLRLDGIVPSRAGPLSFGLSLDRLVGDTQSTDLKARISGGYGRYYLTNSFAFRLGSSGSGGSGLIQVRKTMASSFARLELGYGVGGNRPFQLARLSMDQKYSTDYRVRFGIEHDASRPHPTALLGGLYKNFGPMSVGLNLSLSGGGIRAGLSLSTAVATGSSGRARLRRSGSGLSAAIKARVFLDKNQSGSFDEGDVLLPGIGVRALGRANGDLTDTDGVCALGRLVPDQEVLVSLNEDTFEDPGWLSPRPYIRVLPRRGAAVQVDFPVLESSEVEGTVESSQLEAGTQVALVDASGKLTATSLVDADGTFVFSRVLPGTYQLRVTSPSGDELLTHELEVKAGEVVKGLLLKPLIDAAFA